MPIPGLDSYRGRHAYLALFAGIVLMAIALIGWYGAQRSSHFQIESIRQRVRMAEILNVARDRLSQLENRLQRIVIQPRRDAEEVVSSAVDELDISLRDFETSLGEVSASQARVVADLIEGERRLAAEVEHLLEIRGQTQRWLPAARLVQKEMAPNCVAFLGELQNLVQEGETGLRGEEGLRGMRIMTSMRRVWLGMGESMHLFMAERFGLVDPPSGEHEPDYETRLLYYSEQVEDYLVKLREFAAGTEFALESAARIAGMEENYKAWSNAGKQVVTLMNNRLWRRDLPLLREVIDPILAQMHQDLSRISLNLSQESASQITRLTETTSQLSESILGIAVVGLLIILVTYFYINRNLLQPISQTARALKGEAEGNPVVKPPSARLREMRDLVEAFNEMRGQVRQRQRYLDHIAHHDALTQLPNRILFRDRLEHALAIALRGETQVGLMFLDLDQFKQVNDSLGHMIGDELLKMVAERLRSLVRSSDTVARLGGDEFAILVEGIHQRDDMAVLAKKILQTIERPMKLGAHELRTSVSIGIAIAPGDDVSAECLIRDADAAMYEAKRQGRAAYHFFRGELTTRASEILQRENQVRKAAEQGEFVFHFQPIVDRRNGDLYGFEALVRWQHPERGLLYPDEFLSVLDETGVILAVTEPLLREAVAFQKEQQRLHGGRIGIALNLSARLLHDFDFRQLLLEKLIAREFQDESLILEITEDTLVQDLVEAETFLKQLKSLGARIALDDFGTGQASLCHLRRFPFDLLKIDREFIRDADADNNDASLIRAMVQLAHALGIRVIAEGVESKEQLRFLQQLDCDYLQGYLTGSPAPAAQPLDLERLRALFEE